MFYVDTTQSQDLMARNAQNVGGVTSVVGLATISDRNRNLIAEIKIKDIEIVQTMTKVLYSLVDDECTPEWIKVKIKSVALNKLEKG